MDKLERVGYLCLGLVALVYMLAMFVGMLAVFPFGLIGLVLLLGVGSLFFKVLKERAANKEDDYYAEKVDK